ncbi:hypothetical protein T12_5586 [Trichinella patagoniensis]|uniref:Uncharacterized protein n=1 Tax=Trichinella patagoniensis TaxID=990121 RepID=A0A0V0ZF85_9BILA|nr:hypothetical protein T12_5586 [Trichinella patagoniensis]
MSIVVVFMKNKVHRSFFFTPNNAHFEMNMFNSVVNVSYSAAEVITTMPTPSRTVGRNPLSPALQLEQKCRLPKIV